VFMCTIAIIFYIELLYFQYPSGVPE
jgi:hypothetical protein